MNAASKRGFDILLVLVALFAGWQGLYHVVGETALTSPAQTLAYVGELFTTKGEMFARHAWETVRAFLMALVLSYVIGLAIGIVLGAHKLSGAVGEPILVALYSLPKVTLYPVILLVFGLGLSAKVAFGAIHGIIPVAIFAMNAIRHIKPAYLKTAKTMRLAPRQVVFSVIVPATLPEIVTGLRVGFSLTLLGVIIGEMFASKQGLGFMVINAINLADVETMMAVAFLLFVAAAIANGILLWIDHRLHKRV
jgi:NitT/TauT family transport system permease protein